MNAYSTPTWGYKILSENKINFFHVLLSKINLDNLQSHIPQAQNIKTQKDGSIVISLKPSVATLDIVDKIVSFFTQKEQEFIDTPVYTYAITPKQKNTLSGWQLSFEGCFALMLMADPEISKLISSNWQFINAKTGGFYLEPYTLFLYENHPKIIHPITVQNYEARKTIEQKSAFLIRKMLKNIAQSQPGLEGLALISLVEDKTNLSQKEISKIITERSFGVTTPMYCPFFSTKI